MVQRRTNRRSKTNPFDSDDEESAPKPGYKNPFDDDEGPKKVPRSTNPFDDPLQKGGDLRAGERKGVEAEKNPFDDDGMWSSRHAATAKAGGGSTSNSKPEEPRARRRDVMKEKLASVSDDISSKASQGMDYLRPRSKNLMGGGAAGGSDSHNRQLLFEEQEQKKMIDPQSGYSRERIDRAYRAGESLEGESVQELQEYAVHRAEETTAATFKALKLAEDIKGTATNTSVMLHEQGQQITRTHETAASIDIQLSRGEKLLGSLGGLFSKTWKPNKTRSITGPVITRGDSFKRKAYGMEQRAALGLNNKATSPRGRVRTSTAAVADSSGSQFQSRVKNEFAKQDEALADLSNVLDQLKEMSIDMGTEIQRQTESLVHVEDDVDELGNRVRGANERARRLLGR